ncbi:hypothetical protein CU077_25665 (plasmid) [Escherichia coli]|nr:hypothetical protein CU077_25665 [Escherichia coli]
MGEISVKTGNNARNGGKNSLNRLIRCVCGKKIGPDPRNFNQRVSLGRNDLLIRTFPKGIDLNQADQHYLNQVAMSLNTRPRKALDWLTPLEKFAQLVDYHMAFETVAPHV